MDTTGRGQGVLRGDQQVKPNILTRTNKARDARMGNGISTARVLKVR